MSEFDSYSIHYHTAPQYNWQVVVHLHKGGVSQGWVLFMKRGQPLPANVMKGGKIVLHYSIDDFPNILLILAMDKPLYVSLNTSSGIGMISTSEEAIGDLDRT